MESTDTSLLGRNSHVAIIPGLGHVMVIRHVVEKGIKKHRVTILIHVQIFAIICVYDHKGMLPTSEICL
ncbi:predicted protein [Lichtheimia corymbifera JMRC:FSU:9682]|uniref:Uncharacterized protein n=1 Tax=Lichtheimia corymbifera JMRC:FSU:9682 TaxID=1263082 RepID=A0A068SA19_9FUNG|nr:predicted protein [Lichtheimia corymbifera JMRC:FSU:9682]